MRVHSFIHFAHEGIGAISDWIAINGHSHSSTNFHLGESLPDINDFDMLVIMGGSMSVNDEEIYPWLVEEKKFIKQAIDDKKLVLGICLGSQLISNALGADVSFNIHKEIGWYPLRIIKNGNKIADSLPDNLITFHWHGETFELPEGAVRFAESDGCENQGYTWGDNVIAMQFHMEFTQQMIEGMLAHLENDLIPEQYIQNKDNIRAHVNNCNLNNELLADILDEFTSSFKEIN